MAAVKKAKTCFFILQGKLSAFREKVSMVSERMKNDG